MTDADRPSFRPVAMLKSTTGSDWLCRTSDCNTKRASRNEVVPEVVDRPKRSIVQGRNPKSSSRTGVHQVHARLVSPPVNGKGITFYQLFRETGR